MFGLKRLGKKRLLDIFMVLSVAMIIYATALAPADSAPTTLFLFWIAGALSLLAAWFLAIVELARRLLGKTAPRANNPAGIGTGGPVTAKRFPHRDRPACYARPRNQRSWTAGREVLIALFE